MEIEKICSSCSMIHKTPKGGTACSAHVTGSGKTIPCKRPPIAGGNVCRTHGGALKLTQLAASQRLAMMSAVGEIGDLMRECDIPDQHPVDGLLEVVRVSGSMMRLMTFKVGELNEDPEIQEILVEHKNGELSTKLVSGRDAFWGLDKDGQMAPHPYVTLLRVWTERYERACKTALEAGIEERRLRLAEETSDTFFMAFTKALNLLGLSPEVRSQLTTALANELRRTQLLEANVTEA